MQNSFLLNIMNLGFILVLDLLDQIYPWPIVWSQSIMAWVLIAKYFFRVRDFWTEQGPTDVLLKLKRKEITLFRAAEQLNVTPQTLSNYLISMSQLDTSDMNSSRQSNAGESYDDSDDEADSILPDTPSNNTNVFKSLVHTSSPSGK